VRVTTLRAAGKRGRTECASPVGCGGAGWPAGATGRCSRRRMPRATAPHRGGCRSRCFPASGLAAACCA
jgi:hypothetical protein